MCLPEKDQKASTVPSAIVIVFKDRNAKMLVLRSPILIFRLSHSPLTAPERCWFSLYVRISTFLRQIPRKSNKLHLELKKNSSLGAFVPDRTSLQTVRASTPIPCLLPL